MVKANGETALNSQSEIHTKHEDPMQELNEYMDNVFSEMSGSISFDEFLEKLEEEIEKNTN